MDWDKITEEIRTYRTGAKLSPMAEDSLYGAMWTLDMHPSQTFAKSLTDWMNEDEQKILQCALNTVQQLSQKKDTLSNIVPLPRCNIGLGTFRWKYDFQIIHKAIELGVGFIDTAEGYGFGKVEQELGRCLENSNFDKVTTKIRKDHMSPLALKNAVARSTQKLKRVPHIQLYYPHPKYKNAIKQMMSMRFQGKALSVGVGNCSVALIELWQRELNQYNGGTIFSVQIPLSLINQRAMYTIVPYCQKRGILVFAYSPLGQSYKQLYRPCLDFMAKQYGATPSQIALAWVSYFNGVMPIPQTNSIEHLIQNMESNQLKLKEQDWKELKENYADKNH